MRITSGFRLERHLQGLVALAGLPDDGEPLRLERSPQTFPQHLVVVDEHQSQAHPFPPVSDPSVTRIFVPLPGSDSISRTALTLAARSRIPSNP